MIESTSKIDLNRITLCTLELRAAPLQLSIGRAPMKLIAGITVTVHETYAVPLYR